MRTGAQLEAQLTGQPAVEIYPKSETRFFYKIVVAEISFEVTADGDVRSLTLHQGGNDLIAQKTK